MIKIEITDLFTESDDTYADNHSYNIEYGNSYKTYMNITVTCNAYEETIKPLLEKAINSFEYMTHENNDPFTESDESGNVIKLDDSPKKK